MKALNPAIDSFRYYIDVSYCQFTALGEEMLLKKQYMLSKSEIKSLLKLQEDVNNYDESGTGFFSALDKFGNGKRVAYIPEELKSKGITLRMAVVERYGGYDVGGSGTFLQMLINSKILKKDYFEGLTIKTIRKAYDEIMALGLFYIPYEDFLYKGRIVDVDIKEDIDGITFSEFIQLITDLDNIQRGDKRTGRKNAGIQYSYRHKTDGYVSSPYIKLYWKRAELLYNSKIFTENFLDASKIDHLKIGRLEGTIKNRKHFKTLGFKNNVLGYILEQLDEKRIQKHLWSFLDKYIRMTGAWKIEVVKTVGSKAKPNDLLLRAYTKLYILKGWPLDRILAQIKSDFEVNHWSNATLYRYKNKIRFLYKYILENDEDEEVQSKKGFFQFLRLLSGEVDEI